MQANQLLQVKFGDFSESCVLKESGWKTLAFVIANRPLIPGGFVATILLFMIWQKNQMEEEQRALVLQKYETKFSFIFSSLKKTKVNGFQR